MLALIKRDELLTTVLDMSATSKASAEEDVTTGLDDEMRRLSFGSDASSFSLVSRTSRADSFGSVHSLDTEQSRHSTELRDTRHSEKTFGVESGFEVSRKATRSSGLKRSRSRGSAESWDSKDSSNTLLSLDSVNSIEELSGGGVRISANDKNVESESDSDTQNPVYDPEPKATPDWYTFDGFVPSPTASFKSEFERLARHERWEGGRLKRHHMIELLKAEIFFHWDMRAQKLYHWQELCEELGIEKIPTTMTQCKKVIMSPKHLFNTDMWLLTIRAGSQVRQRQPLQLDRPQAQP
ncbi:hypothetical protein BDW02DRAFT_567253 [Decorospora gaudefroyi]|uniref:Uncharacterized protein n=1 Tax=Decorospora gaudefroyi TaxID=184978 RepID=A0A6A5KPB7_9PLEO|nr:hypothetical protein BDW02DRAFT_567253 [Decorospora gaudefroyi]